MSTDTWQAGVSADWITTADWSGGVPSTSTTASISGPGSFVVTLYESESVGALTLSAAGAEFYEAGTLALGGTLALQAGTLALAYGAIDGGTLALAGGQFLSTGGTLSGVAVQGTLNLSQQQSSLVVTGGLSLSGVGGVGAGSIALTGGYATLQAVGSQTFDNATITIGASGYQPGGAGAATLGISQAGGAAAGATLTLGAGLWLRGVAGQGEVVVGSVSPLQGPGLPAALVNLGTITAATAGEMLSIVGNGSFANQGTIGVSNSATLELATAGFSNTGTILVSSATLALGGTFASSLLSGLGAVTLSNGQVQVAGTVQNAGSTLTLGAGASVTATLGALSLAGTIAGGTVVDTGGGLSFAPGTGVLDGATYQGVLNLSGNGAAATLADGAGVTSGTGAAGAILDTGAGSTLLLRGAETLNGVQIQLGSGSAASAISTSDTWLASSAATATLGSGASVVQAGHNAALLAVGWSGVAGFGPADTLVNQGSITGAVAGGRLSFGGYGTIINQGTVSVSGGDTLGVTVAQFANAGTLIAGAGGTVLLGQAANAFAAAPAWSNSGSILVAGGTLVLSGALGTAQLGNITETSGTVVLAGTLSNAGATLAVSGSGGGLSLPNLSLTGTIAGGTVTDSAGALCVGAGTGALLDGVSYGGTLLLGGASAFLRVRDGLALSGAADIIGAGATLDFQGAQTFDNAQVLIGSAAGDAIALADNPGQAGGSTLTLGPNLSVTQSGAIAAIGQGTGGLGDMIVSQGAINAGVAGGTLTLGGAGFTNQGTITVGQGDTLAIAAGTFSNTGVVSVAGVLSLAGSLSLAQLGQVTLSGGAVSVGGTLNLAGGTLSVGSGNAFGRVQLTGTIAGGTILDAGGGLGSLGGTLSGVTYDGVLDLSRPFAQLSVARGLTVQGLSAGQAGEILLTGAQSSLTASSSETLATQIVLGSAAQVYAGQKLAAPVLQAAAGVQLTLGAASKLTLSGTAGTLGTASAGWSDSIVNQGSVSDAVAGGVLSIASSFFTNAGTLSASGGGVVTIGDAGFLNTGTLSVGTSSSVLLYLLDYYAAPNAGAAAFSNAGTVLLQGGVVQELTGGGLFPPVPLLNLAGGDMVGAGGLYAQVTNDGTIEARGGLLAVNQAVLGAGTLQIDAGSTLELEAGVSAGQVVDFASNSELVVLSPSTFAGTLSGFGAGDLLDLPGQSLTGVGSSSGTLVVSTATQNFRFVGTTLLGGEISAGHDVHGGATVSFTPQTVGPGSTALLVPVSQPKMLFWASPAGDVFQGTSANLAGAHVANWSAADSLDITDLAPAHATLATTQASGLDTLVLSDGSHTATLSLAGTFSAGGFHLASDTHGGTLLTYTGH